MLAFFSDSAIMHSCKTKKWTAGTGKILSCMSKLLPITLGSASFWSVVLYPSSKGWRPLLAFAIRKQKSLALGSGRMSWKRNSQSLLKAKKKSFFSLRTTKNHYTTDMENKKTKTHYEQVMEARKSFAEWNQKRLEDAEKYTINWDNFGTDKPTVEKKEK